LPFDAVVFDLDGTLVDTAPDLQVHVNSVLEEVGRPGLDLDEVRLLVGNSARTLLRRGLEATGGVPAAVDLDLLYGRFLERYTARPADRSTVYRDVIEVLEGLEARGLRLGVCTNKAQAPSDRLLAALGLERFFGAIGGGDAVPAKKPAPGHLRAVLERLGGPAGTIGDGRRQRARRARREGARGVLRAGQLRLHPGAGAPPRSRSGDRSLRRATGRARAPRRGGGVMPRKIGAPRAPLTPAEAGS
jgi:phosphoglycolate phosphatase